MNNYNNEFIEHALYITKRCPGITLTKLYKLIWFANIEYAERYGTLMIKDVFLKKQFGPVPQTGKDYIESIKDSGSCEDENFKIDSQWVGKYFCHFIIPKREPNPDYFTEADFEVLDAVLEKYGSKTATELSRISHDNAWKEAEDHAKVDISLDIKDTKIREIVAEQYDNIVFMTQMRTYA